MKHTTKMLAALVLATGLAACATTPTVHTDSSPTANFSQYHSYSWATDSNQGMPPLIAQRVTAAVDAQLQAKGWQKVAEGGDVLVIAHGSTQQQQDIDTFYTAPRWGGWGWGGMGMYGVGMGAGMASTTVRTYDVGTLIVDMFDVASKQAIWRGTASATVPSSPEKTNAAIDAGVTKMFANFPPQ